MSRRLARSPPSSPVTPSRCPYCYNSKIRVKGLRPKKLSTGSVYICHAPAYEDQRFNLVGVTSDSNGDAAAITVLAHHVRDEISI